MTIMKRISAPRFWKVERKSRKYVISPAPGPHKKTECLPLGVLLRDYLKIAENIREVKHILNTGLVKVNNRVRKSYKFPVGIMDMLHLGETYYRMMPGKGGLVPKEIKKGSELRLCKVIGKTYVKSGKVQLNISGGENMIITKEEDDYNTGDVIIMDINSGKIKKVLRFEKGSIALITGGRNIGEKGKIENIEIIKNPLPTLVDVKLREKSVKVPKDYVFVIGEKEPEIEM